MRWDKDLEIIVNKLSIKYSVDANIVKDVVTTFFSIFKKAVQHPSMPSIMIHNFGTFKPSLKRLYGRRKDWMESLEKAEDEKVKEVYQAKINSIQLVIDRLEREKTTRNDEEE